MKRVLCFITVAVMTLCVMTSCSSEDSSSENDSSSVTDSRVENGSPSTGHKIAKAAIGFGAKLLVPTMSGYVNKTQQQTANSNAKMVFASANSALAEFQQEGLTIKSDCAGKKVRFSQLNDSTDFDKAVSRYLGWDDRYNDTILYFKIENDRVTAASWQKNESSPVGKYPLK